MDVCLISYKPLIGFPKQLSYVQCPPSVCENSGGSSSLPFFHVENDKSRSMIRYFLLSFFQLCSVLDLSSPQQNARTLVPQSPPTLCNPMDCSLPGSSVHGIFLAIYWSGLPFPSPGDLPNPGIELRSLAL